MSHSHKPRLFRGDCLEVLKTFASDSLDAIVTDPPYGLAFMGKKWDYDVPEQAIWEECLRVLKPGGHLLAFAGTRTQHRMAVRIEDAGFEIRDMIAWVYSSGMPKSLNVSKALDKAMGVEGEVIGEWKPTGTARPKKDGSGGFRAKTGGEGSHEAAFDGMLSIHAPASPISEKWSGYGTGLKPSMEPITLARKPIDGSVVENIVEWECGAINIDGCRVSEEKVQINTWDSGAKPFGGGAGLDYTSRTSQGRWPANLIHDGSDDVTELFPQTPPSRKANRGVGIDGNTFKHPSGRGVSSVRVNDDNGGSASRFFYCAKANKKERGDRNNHPTVKPIALMRYLVRLVTPEGGSVLDPFMGSGTTGLAAIKEGLRFYGIEKDEKYFEIARERLEIREVIVVK